jgi:peptidoglycan-associated lipoprotein
MRQVFVLTFVVASMTVAGWSQAVAQSVSGLAGQPSTVQDLGGNPQSSPVVPENSGQDYADRAVQPVGSSAAQSAPAPTAADVRQAFHSNIKDVYFALNEAKLTPDDEATLKQDAEWLKAHPDVQFTIEGDADERGGIAYNLHLSDWRALATRDALIKYGVPEKQILFATGWGKLYPSCVQSDEPCWRQNRRSHLAPWPPDDLGQRASNHLPGTNAETSSGGGGK